MGMPHTFGSSSTLSWAHGTYLLDKEHLPIYPAFEYNTIVMTEEDPSSVQAHEKREKARAEKAARMPTAEEVSQVFLRSKQDQLGYLIQATLRIEKGLATLNQNQESLERIVETKFYDLDMKVTEIQTAVEQIQEEEEERRGKATTDAFKRVPRGLRSAAVPVQMLELQCQHQQLQLQCHLQHPL